MIIALFLNNNKTHAKALAQQIDSFLCKHQVAVVVEDEHSSLLNIAPLSSVPLEEIDFAISLGGDGTILRLLHRHPELKAPILAINLGSLGFMADITAEETLSSLEDLIHNRYTTRSRMIIEGQVNKQNGFAVNEIVIHRANNPGLIDLNIHVDGRYLNTFSADGIIIATPNGSTAYSLAAGGPILSPEVNGLVVTPICPHTISNRPLVLLPEIEMQIEYINCKEPVEVIFDGFPCFALNAGERLRIRRSHRTFNLVTMSSHDYFSTLRTKLGWVGKLRA